MGGANQATCPVPSTSKSAPKATNPVRFHEDTPNGNVDFHDDKAKLKCAIDSASFFSAYNRWRPDMSSELRLLGSDGKKGHASVTFTPHIDDSGEMQVSMMVERAKIGKTITDLDKLAGF